MKAENLESFQSDCWRKIAIALIDPRSGLSDSARMWLAKE
jgi:hypothetical protein